MRGNEGRTNNSTLLCLACYEDRLASVFDNAPDLKLFRVEDNKICPAGYLSLPSKDPKDRTSAIMTCGATFLICGAICGCTMNELEQAGVRVIPWITGMTDQVLAAYQQNCLENHVMPGCRGRGRCGQGNRGFRARKTAQEAMHPNGPTLNSAQRSK
ncbi:NifB/NifX family molybdenum-iron cluster-binding protein [Desulfovibrio sp. JC022]|uniref:NifB/NifX family molybdenum-iron cluster-binding protein n=1 Tax=Desulfovibrio sp. JC022 TaxID=2593642 RepID=UPI0013CFC89F|nr:NifB/NifX family molybdenum-iron cluster-binding protein [Desulfovibrio sp. JC022]NDV23168.1 dinitrogenase iron-molybdenum cofactor biosynthesis protein [Desulfovibrio sp. JC022]